MDFYLGLAQIVGVHTLLGLSAYCVLLTGQVSLAQAGFFAIGAYVAAMLTVLAGWHIVPAIAAASFVAGATACAVSFPALRVQLQQATEDFVADVVRPASRRARISRWPGR